MKEPQTLQEIRTKLYDEVWSEPMTTVAVRYGLSDNGLRKRCKSMDIPLPPAGYWAKVKAGKTVPVRIPLPKYVSNTPDLTAARNESQSTQKKNTGFQLLKADYLSLEEVKAMHGFDLLMPGMYEVFYQWCEKITVPGRISDYHDLVLKHQTELEYRTNRDKEQPFRDLLGFMDYSEKMKYRDDEAVIPIKVSQRQYNRACRITDTILKAFQELKAKFSVERGHTDNLTISLVGIELSFQLTECRTKRRYLADKNLSNDFRPLYEESFDGRLQILWTVSNAGIVTHQKTPSKSLTFIDSNGNQLESQISSMILEMCRLCCDHEISQIVSRKQWRIEYDQEQNRREQQEQAEKQKRLEEKRQARINAMVNSLPKHAASWFRRNQLSRYADELEEYLKTVKDEEACYLLQNYIQMVRDNANRFDPIAHVIEEMKQMDEPVDE